MNFLDIETVHYGDRLTFLRQFISKSDLGLEIGPSHSPILPKKEGYHSLVVDAFSTDELMDKYRDLAVDIDKIEEVDYIWRGENLSKIIPEAGHLDYMLASHVIEHIPDFLGFFQQSQQLLASEGQLILVVPDKRKCFDYFRPVSTTGQILQAFHAKHTVHTVAAVFDNHANYASYNGYGSWFSSDEKKKIDLKSNVKGAYQLFLKALEDKSYYDVHGWVFSPASFLLIIKDLIELELLHLEVESFYFSDGHEFYIVFKNSSPSSQGWLDTFSRSELQHLIASGF